MKKDYKKLIKNLSNFWAIGNPEKYDYIQLVFWYKGRIMEMQRILNANNINNVINEEGIKVLFGDKLSESEKELVNAIKAKDFAKDNIICKYFFRKRGQRLYNE